ncbi:MAG: acyl-ACP--UDP-N-acetylglucosamine O-acyltransferase [Verrucomicrobia bacterium]|nr:acyl-ACP--UDP-N-acetylglucosamine O-acyltransferase [Verrucomicrobiota bacterium]
MSVKVHPTAVVENGAILAEGVEIGAFAYIGPNVVLGSGCKVHHHASVEGLTTLGKNNEIFPYAYLGGRTQDKKWRGDQAPIVIGDCNIFREYSTVHPPTFLGKETRIGDGGLFCSYSHIGHECIVGNDVVFSNNATLAGHVWIGDRVVIGGLTAVHQFCRIGTGAILGGCSKVVQDVLPYMMADGHPSETRGINKVGMERAGFTPERIQIAKRIYKLIFRSGLLRSQAVQQLRSGDVGSDPMVTEVVEFISMSDRGFC